MRRWALVLIALPPVALAIVRAAFLAMAFAGAHPFWQWQPLTLSEAAALRDSGEVARLLADGQDPNGVYSVREGFLNNGPASLTPVQAARANHRDEIVQLLIDGGARAD
jgi:hypothetical protein